MKGFVALAIAAVPHALAAGIKRPIQLALSYDEEVGCIGAPFMIAEMRKTLPPAKAAIIGEPSLMQVVTGHKGTIGYKTTVRGYEVHSSMIHEGVSAVMTAARLIEWHRLFMAARREISPRGIAGFPRISAALQGKIQRRGLPNIWNLWPRWRPIFRAFARRPVSLWSNAPWCPA